MSNYLLGIPDTNFSGRSTRIDLKVLRLTAAPTCGIIVMSLLTNKIFVKSIIIK